MKSARTRFKDRYRVDTKTGCWVWLGAKHERGYGRMRWGNRQAGAGQISWFLRHGKWPPGHLFLCHKCDNTACVNPDHLFLGTAKDNNLDRSRKHGMRRLPQIFEERAMESVRADFALADMFEAKKINTVDINQDPARAVAEIVARDLGRVWKLLVAQDGLAFANTRQGVALAMNALRPILETGDTVMSRCVTALGTYIGAGGDAR